jgi:DNA-directed RNA polymerase subunit RPC12/RpoP
LIGRVVAASIISYLFFLLPALTGSLTIIFAAIASAIISGLLLHGLHSLIPPLSGSAASFLTNYFSELFLSTSSQVYFNWPYWALGFLASPALAFLVAEFKAERRAEREIEVAAVEEAARPKAEIAEEVEFIKCPSCGGQIPSDSIYCPLCGSKVAEER